MKKNKALHFRVTAEQRNNLERAAKRKGQILSVFLRNYLSGAEERKENNIKKMPSYLAHL